MGSYNFRKDLADSQKAVELVMKHLISKDIVCYELETREEQKLGDICAMYDEVEVNVEVKFDMMSESTGNLCFEMSNGKKLTGILDTKADEVFYVVPTDGKMRIFKFEMDRLRKYILDPLNVTHKKGGDKRKFDLALVSVERILKDNVAYEVVTVDA